MARTKGPNAIDVHVGSRMRMRRMMLGMSQEKLAKRLWPYISASAEVRKWQEPNGGQPAPAGG